MSTNPVIIILGYNRANSLSRLFRTINEASYTQAVKLIISLDGGSEANVIECAEKFNFKHGEKEVILHDENLGLKNHVFYCAGLTKKYGSAIILEDDLIVDTNFYQYACDALSINLREEKNIAGYALYSPRYNEYAQLPFEPVNTNHSVYAMQVPCSWGQVWTHEQWTEFESWYEAYTEDQLKNAFLPDAVKKWGHGSWKKIFNTYLVEKNKYFLYPYNSYTSNCGEGSGVNISFSTGIFQVPVNLHEVSYRNKKFPLFDDLVKYDAFMELSDLKNFSINGIKISDIEIDLYGTKTITPKCEKEYLLTIRRISKYIKRYPLKYKPFISNTLSFFEESKGVLRLAKISDVVHSGTADKYHLIKYLSYTKLDNKTNMLSLIRGFMLEIVNRFRSN